MTAERTSRFCREELGVESVIPTKPRRSTTVVATTPYRLEVCRVLSEPGDAESRPTALEGRIGHVGDKAQVGRGAYRQASQAVQALLRGLVYNVHRVIALNTS